MMDDFQWGYLTVVVELNMSDIVTVTSEWQLHRQLQCLNMYFVSSLEMETSKYLYDNSCTYVVHAWDGGGLD